MTDYVDAGEAVPHRTLSAVKGEAPATSDVNFERILNARSEPENWLTYYGTYDGQRFSSLDQIDKQSVKKLVPAWVFQAGTAGLQAGASTYSFEASPLVVEGVMYVSGPDGKVWAIDAVSGEELWRYKHASPVRRLAVLRERQPRRRRGSRPGVHVHPQRPPDRARRRPAASSCSTSSTATCAPGRAAPVRR